jgi:hypothetical protein
MEPERRDRIEVVGERPLTTGLGGQRRPPSMEKEADAPGGKADDARPSRLRALFSNW